MSEADAVAKVRGEPKRMSTLAERNEWLRRYRESGLSIRQFCEEHKLVLNTFYQWRSKSRLAFSALAVAAVEPAFTEIKLQGSSVPWVWAAELQRPNGIILRVGTNLPAGLLEQLLRVC